MCVCVCVSVRKTEVDGVNLRSWVVQAREKRCDNGRLLFRSLDRFSLRLEFALKFFARVFLFRVYFVFVLLSFSLSLSLSLSLSFFPREDEEEVIKRDFLDWCRVRKRVRMTVYDCKKTPQSDASRTNMVWLLNSRCSFFHLFLSPFFIFYTYNILAFGEKRKEWKREAEQRRGL